MEAVHGADGQAGVPVVSASTGRHVCAYKARSQPSLSSTNSHFSADGLAGVMILLLEAFPADF